MKEIIRHPVYGEIVYEESFWLGKKSITVNGIPAQSVSKNVFVIDGKNATVKGNYLTGVTLNIESETIALTPKAKWYETVLAVIPIVFMLTWGNSVELCAIFPVVGGAIGGFLGAVGGCASMILMKKQKNPLLKVLIGAGIAATTIFAAFLVALVMIASLVGMSAA